MKIVRLNENDLIRLVKRVINEENKKQEIKEDSKKNKSIDSRFKCSSSKFNLK